MRNLLLLIALSYASQVMAVCTSPISRTNFSPSTVLSSTKLNADLNALYTQANELPGDCITAETVTSAKILNGTIVNADISASAAIERTKLAASSYVISSAIVSETITSTSLVDVTGLSVSITTNGGAVEISLIPYGDDTNISSISLVQNSGTSVSGRVSILRGSSVISTTALGIGSFPTDFINADFPASSIRFIDVIAAGTYTYKIQALREADADSIGFTRMALMARELR